MARALEGGAEPVGLAGLRRQFEAWRARRKSGEGIPRNLWRSAGALAQRYGAGKIAQALGLDCHKLKQISLGHWPVRRSKRPGAGLAVRGTPSVTEVGPGAQFIELQAPVGCSPPLDGEAVVEVLGADGTRIRLRLKDSSPALPVVMAALRGRS